MTLPLLLSMGPPLLPGEMGAVIWSILPRAKAFPSDRMLLMFPCENVPSNPRGLPTA